ncbi:MAG: hypothetical protein OIF32_02060, partial [Campylobacterales bacterium]|nr:hypothetical protein [Campylobacterales bacterium]
LKKGFLAMIIQSSGVSMSHNRSYSNEIVTDLMIKSDESSDNVPVFEKRLSNQLEEGFNLNKEVFVHTGERLQEFLEINCIGKKQSYQESLQHHLKEDGITASTSSLLFSQTQITNEKVSFNSKGFFNTADNQKVEFDLNLNFSSFFKSNYLNKSSLIDPLVINIDLPSAQVTNKTFSFDIDSDGKKEKLASLAKGSGFLALDKNQDGTINNGNELFGATSGDGFKDLSQYDDNNDGWIDETDGVFNKLKVWNVDGDKRELIGLVEAGVGAIYLGSEETQFSQRDVKHGILGDLKKTGIFVKDNLDIGTLQQLELRVLQEDIQKDKKILKGEAPTLSDLLIGLSSDDIPRPTIDNIFVTANDKTQEDEELLERLRGLMSVDIFLDEDDEKKKKASKGVLSDTHATKQFREEVEKERQKDLEKISTETKDLNLKNALRLVS